MKQTFELVWTFGVDELRVPVAVEALYMPIDVALETAVKPAFERLRTGKMLPPREQDSGEPPLPDPNSDAPPAKSSVRPLASLAEGFDAKMAQAGRDV